MILEQRNLSLKRNNYEGASKCWSTYSISFKVKSKSPKLISTKITCRWSWPTYQKEENNSLTTMELRTSIQLSQPRIPIHWTIQSRALLELTNRLNLSPLPEEYHTNQTKPLKNPSTNPFRRSSRSLMSWTFWLKRTKDRDFQALSK